MTLRWLGRRLFGRSHVLLTGTGTLFQPFGMGLALNFLRSVSSICWYTPSSRRSVQA